MMVAQELSPADVLDPARDIAFPESVVSMMRGELGQPPGGWPPALQAKILKGEQPISVRPGALLGTADLAALRKEAEDAIGRSVSEQEFASWLMYPKVFTEFAAASETYGPVSCLPTPIYFYGMQPEQEILVEIERGKVLVIRCLAIGETNEKGMVTVFFELNGQPRRVKVPNRAHGVRGVETRRKAEPGRDGHVGAPMPGVIAGIMVKPGQDVRAGDLLLTLEAMKMETALHAERNGRVAEVLVSAGTQVDAKDLLIVLE
jgi:pyruvate carboxylase